MKFKVQFNLHVASIVLAMAFISCGSRKRSLNINNPILEKQVVSGASQSTSRDSVVPDSAFSSINAGNGANAASKPICSNTKPQEISLKLNLSVSFSAHCAGCHGDFGQGQEQFPALKKTSLSATEFREIVRAGKNSSENEMQNRIMPSFESIKYSDNDLSSDFNLLVSGEAQQNHLIEENCLSISQKNFAPLELEKALAEGKEVWRKTEKDAPCFSCHGPDPVDLAKIGFSDGVILRRAMTHLTEPNAKKIVDYVQAFRQKLSEKNENPGQKLELFDPLMFRPLQPGGAPSPGNSNLERDLNWFTNLQQIGVLFATKKLQTHDEIRIAIKQLNTIDLSIHKQPIVFSRYTEDEFRGSDHKTTDEWIPQFPMRVIEGKSEELLNLHDNYLADAGNDLKFWAYFDRILELQVPDIKWSDAVNVPEKEVRQKSNWTSALVERYKAVQIFQFQLRNGRLPDKTAGLKKGDESKMSFRSPFWKVGGSLFQSESVNGQNPYAKEIAFSVPPSTAGWKERPVEIDTLRIVLPWWQMGQIWDPGLLNTQPGKVFGYHVERFTWHLTLSGTDWTKKAYDERMFPRYLPFFAAKTYLDRVFLPLNQPQVAKITGQTLVDTRKTSTESKIRSLYPVHAATLPTQDLMFDNLAAIEKYIQSGAEIESLGK